MKQIVDWAGKYAKGPRYWLWGTGGHAFFRAGQDIGMKSVPRCPVSACKALCLNTTCKFLADYVSKLDVLLQAASEGESTLVEVARVVYSSPPMHSKNVMAEAIRLKYQQLVCKARIRTDVNKIAYNMFFDATHAKHSLLSTLREVMRNRWCKCGFIRLPVLSGSSREALLGVVAQRSLSKLRLLSKWVPPRVHNSNVRLHFNGWHTEARYQRRLGSVCMFCRGEDSEDSIEHILRCPFIHNLFPASLKKGYPPRVPPKTFFLYGLDKQHQMAVSLMVHAIYSMHNNLRHDPHHGEVRQTMARIAQEVGVSWSFRNAWADVFGWRLRSASRPPRHHRQT